LNSISSLSSPSKSFRTDSSFRLVLDGCAFFTEDENHSLKGKLRFKGDDFEFKTPFYYEKKYPDRPLCVKRFANERIAPMSEPYEAIGMCRRCLVCSSAVEIEGGV
jgi:hypothetical protein